MNIATAKFHPGSPILQKFTKYLRRQFEGPPGWGIRPSPSLYSFFLVLYPVSRTAGVS